jgi:hypothetical protein
MQRRLSRTNRPMEDAISSLLGLSGYRVTGVTREGEDDVVAVDLPGSDGCPRCGLVSGRVHQRRSRPSRILWGFWGERCLNLSLQAAASGASSAGGPSARGCRVSGPTAG